MEINEQEAIKRLGLLGWEIYLKNHIGKNPITIVRGINQALGISLIYRVKGLNSNLEMFFDFDKCLRGNADLETA